MVAQPENCQAKTEQILQTHLEDRFWRLNNLYFIMNKRGKKVLFTMNDVQERLYRGMHWRNIIPKSRQHGITTLVALFLLDACLFNEDVRAGIIAHKVDDAKKFFRDKIKFAYDNLPDDLKGIRSTIKDDTQEILFENNSSIYVAASMRSGTLQYLHISEYGWICTHTANKAKEIKSGAIPTVHAGGITFIESTYEGPYGDFPDLCDDAKEMQEQGKLLGPKDFKLHFFAWHDDPENRTDPEFVPMTKKDHKYFDKLENIFKKKIDIEQRAWYVAEKKLMKHLMFGQYPSTFEEASVATVEGSYYAVEMSQMREEGRICKVPFLPAYPVHAVCDLGMGGNMPWIFFQVVGLEVHLIDCFSLSEKDDVRGGAAFYKRMLDNKREDRGFSYGKYFCPFDVNKGEIGTGDTIYKTFQQNGITFEILDCETNVLNGIQRLINIFPSIYIDSEHCQDVITAWLCYHREWIENLSRYDERPAHDKSSHYADVGRYLSKIIVKKLYTMIQRSANNQTQADTNYSALG